MKIKARGIKKNERLDVFLCKELSLSRSRVQRLIFESGVIVNGTAQTDKNLRIKNTDYIEVDLPAATETAVVADGTPLDVIFEDSEILVINKRAGMLVHPTSAVFSQTVVNGLLCRYGSSFAVGDASRPGIVHRLDRDTSGVMVVARTENAHRSLVGQFKDRQVKKRYIALVHGCFSGKEKVETFFGRHPLRREKMSVLKGAEKGKRAETHIGVIEKMAGYTLLDVFPKTGRTHQIRVHLSYLGYPIVGDKTYGSRKNRKDNDVKVAAERQMLHAASIGFVHPGTGKRVEFDVPTADDMVKIIDKIRREDFKDKNG